MALSRRRQLTEQIRTTLNLLLDLVEENEDMIQRIAQLEAESGGNNSQAGSSSRIVKQDRQTGWSSRNVKQDRQAGSSCMAAKKERQAETLAKQKPLPSPIVEKNERCAKNKNVSLCDYEQAYLNESHCGTVNFRKTTGLNEFNNESYRYLRSVGNDWQYDVKNVHPRMLERLYKRFDTFDLDTDGIMTMEEIMYWPDRMKELVHATDDQIENMREAVKEFFFHKGVGAQGLLRENFVEANRVFAEAERERMKRGEKSLICQLGDSYYEVLDDNADGTVGLEELKTMMKAFDVPQEAAYTFLAKGDFDGSGRLERDECAELFRVFWMSDYDPQWDGIYAYKY